MSLETTLPVLDLGDAEAPVPHSAGWCPAILTDANVQITKADEDRPKKSQRKNFVLAFSALPTDAETPNARFGNIYVPIPSDDEIDYHKKFTATGDADARAEMRSANGDYHSADGRTKYAQKMAWVRTASTAFGGKESGAIDPMFFKKQIGKQARVNIEHEEGEQGPRARLAFLGLQPL